MSKKLYKKTTKPQAPATDYPPEHDLKGQQQRLRKAAAGANALKSAPTAMPALAPAPVAVTGKRLMPLNGSRPKRTPPQGEPKQAQTTPAAATAPKASPAAATPTPIAASFVLLRPNAKQVSVCGEFNGWSPNAAPMKRQDDERWETTLILEPGRYQYKFLVDGEWIPDPLAHETTPNPLGSLNSVMEVRA